MGTQNVVYTYTGILFTLKWKEVVIRATTWVNLEDNMLSEISPSQMNKSCVSSHMRNLRFLETERMTGATAGAGGTGSCLIGRESQFCRWQVLETVCITMWMHFTLTNYTVKVISCMFVYFTRILKKWQTPLLNFFPFSLKYITTPS